MNEVVIAPHALKHGVSPEDIECAWMNFVAMQYRGTPHDGEVAVVGCDKTGKLVELVAMQRAEGIVIYHAMRPPTEKMLSELGLPRRHR